MPVGNDYVPGLGSGSVLASPAQLIALGTRMCDDEELQADQGVPGRHRLAVFREERGGHDILWHTGGLPGWKALVAAIAERRLVVACVANMRDGAEDLGPLGLKVLVSLA